MENNQLQQISIWVVWYEDRFGYGPDRDPASVVTFFPTEAEAEKYVESDIGPIDIASGKFDGLFIQEWNALNAIKSNIVKREEVLQKLSL